MVTSRHSTDWEAMAGREPRNEHAEPKPMRVSVIVPVYNGERVLPGLLEALSAQTYPREHTEILVVNNNSVDRTGAVIDQWLIRGVTHLRCEQQGSYAARNLAIAHARGDVLAFTDADCRPCPDWLQAGVDTIRRAKVDRIAGLVTLRLCRKPGLWELVDATNYKLGEKLAATGLVATANLLITRTAIDKVGPFDDTIISGGDMEFGRRCNALGISYRFSPEVKVTHRARGAWEQIRRSRRIGVGLAQTTSEPLLTRANHHWKDLVPGASLAGLTSADLGEVAISKWRWVQVLAMRYLAVDMVRSAAHVWGRWLLRHGRAERTLAKVSRSG